MSKHAAVRFNKALHKLFEDRTHWLRRAVKSTKTKRPPKFNRAKVDKAIVQLQQLASECIAADFATTAFESLVAKKKQWHVKGWGCDKKKKSFDGFLSTHIPHKNFVYVFWNGKKCLYVGKTEDGKGRPQDHFSKFWFSHATRIDIHAVSAASQVLKLECLAKHRFNPSYNKIDPPTKKWYKKCPVCEVHDMVHDDMRRIFGLKKS